MVTKHEDATEILIILENVIYREMWVMKLCNALNPALHLLVRVFRFRRGQHNVVRFFFSVALAVLMGERDKDSHFKETEGGF